MGPTENLKEIRELAKKLAAGHEAYQDHDDPQAMLDDAQRLANTFIRLDASCVLGHLPLPWIIGICDRLEKELGCNKG